MGPGIIALLRHSGEPDGYVAVVAPRNSVSGREKDLANAKLIAVAPEMASLLAALVAYLDDDASTWDRSAAKLAADGTSLLLHIGYWDDRQREGQP